MSLALKMAVLTEGYLKYLKNSNHNHIHKAVNPRELSKGQTAYSKTIQSILKDQAATASNHIGSWEDSLKSRYDFMEKIEPDLNRILYNNAHNMEQHIEGFYNTGKANGFKEMTVKTFFGESDKHALFTLKNYNFDLIRNASNDLRNHIREEVWRGQARGDSLQEIAKRIKVPKTVTTNGRVISGKVRSQAIARTESMRAMNQGHLLSYQQYGLEMVEVLPSGTEGEFNCDCEDIVANSPYKMDENLPELPSHPNCTHTYSPYGLPSVEGAMDPDTYVNLVLQGETPVASI